MDILYHFVLKYPKLASASEKLCCFAWVFDLDQNTDIFVRYIPKIELNEDGHLRKV